MSFEKYLKKLNLFRQDLWQRPKDSYLPEDLHWYCDSPLEKKMSATMMLDISTIAKLSQRNKNHSVSATSITILNAGGISGRHIMKISSHRSETSLTSYSHHGSNANKISDKFLIHCVLCHLPNV